MKDFTERWSETKEQGKASYMMYLNIKKMSEIAKQVKASNLRGGYSSFECGVMYALMLTHMLFACRPPISEISDLV